jgi:hypothetical protein
MMENNDLVLYILMRTDMASMNPGKACAQAAHAANQFVEEHHRNATVKAWQKQTGTGFGTTIVLSANQEILTQVVTYPEGDFVVGLVVDPTYPVRDGEVTHSISVVTCAYVFGTKQEIRPLIDKLGLELMK